MANDRQIVVRAPDVLVSRIDALVPFIQADPELSAVGPITRSAVARLALWLGVTELERRQRGGQK